MAGEQRGKSTGAPSPLNLREMGQLGHLLLHGNCSAMILEYLQEDVNQRLVLPRPDRVRLTAAECGQSTVRVCSWERRQLIGTTAATHWSQMAEAGTADASGRTPIGYMTRVECFSACHRLHRSVS